MKSTALCWGLAAWVATGGCAADETHMTDAIPPMAPDRDLGAQDTGAQGLGVGIEPHGAQIAGSAGVAAAAEQAPAPEGVGSAVQAPANTGSAPSPSDIGAAATPPRVGQGGSDVAQGAAEGQAGAGGEVEPGTADPGDRAPVFHVFLLLGQSNMAGYPKAQTEDRVQEPRIRVLGYDDCAATGRKRDEWAVAEPPLHECWNGAIGPGDYFAKTLLEVLPEQDTIGLVPCAISGERIETFLKDGGSKYEWILHRAQLAQQSGGAVEGILFHQGESNNTDPSWPGKVRGLVADLRADLGLADAPFLAGELAYEGACAGHNRLVNQLPDLIDNAQVITAEGLALDATDTTYHVHFGHGAQVTFGQRYAAAMIEALGW